MILKYLKSELNPQGIPYSELKKGRYIVVDIPICHEKGVVEVEGVISKELWLGSPRCVYSQVRITKQNTLCDIVHFSCDIHAIYPELVKCIK